MLNLLHFVRPPTYFYGKLAWAIKSGKRTEKLYLMLFAECVYEIWLQRNDTVFNQRLKTPAAVVKEVLFKVASRASESQRRLLLSLTYFS